MNTLEMFAAWGDRDTRDNAMMIDLIMGAVAVKLGATEITITADDLEAVAPRIRRKPPAQNSWGVEIISG